MITDTQIIIINEQGEEVVKEILFTYFNEERNKNYVFLFDKDNEDEVDAFIYNEEDGTLSEIEDDEEYNEVEEVFNAYNEDPLIEEIKE